MNEINFFKRNLTFAFIAIIFLAQMAYAEENLKTPNVSGQFYPADAQDLQNDLKRYLREAESQARSNPIDIVIVPHAGYVFSGGVAAHGFKAVSSSKYKTVVILAPSHFVNFDGVSIWSEGGFQTPMGIVEVDQAFASELSSKDDKFTFYKEAYAKEHSLEVEIPFLQEIYDDFKIVPVVMGYPDIKTIKRFAESLNEVIGTRDDVLLVVSTDLSHYHDDKTARAMDNRTIEAIKQLDIETIWKETKARTMEMCGFIPVTTALFYAKERGLDKVEVLKYANSGDINGDQSRVVGYTSILISKNSSEAVNPAEEQSQSNFTLEQKRELIKIARETIDQFIKTGEAPEFKVTDPRLLKEEGAFVTIHKDGKLRGCIGNILGHGPLYLTVREMAVKAATSDPRFNPVQKNELLALDVEVSVLSEPKQIKNVDDIILGVHGVIISKGPFNRGVFLPKVATDTGWSKEEFLTQLSAQKAGLAPDAWKDPSTTIEIFTADEFSEKDVGYSK